MLTNKRTHHAIHWPGSCSVCWCLAEGCGNEDESIWLYFLLLYCTVILLYYVHVKYSSLLAVATDALLSNYDFK